MSSGTWWDWTPWRDATVLDASRGEVDPTVEVDREKAGPWLIQYRVLRRPRAQWRAVLHQPSLLSREDDVLLITTPMAVRVHVSEPFPDQNEDADPDGGGAEG